MRLIGAWLVLFTHSAALLGHPAVLGFPWATYGLALFFTLSGALVSGSAQRCRGISDFFMRRLRRLVPAYLACSLGTVLLLWPLCSSLPWLHTLRPDHWIPVWLRLLTHGAQWNLPETFGTHAFSSANGSVWSIPYEVLLYVGLGLAWFGVLARTRRPWILPATLWGRIVAFFLWNPSWLPDGDVRLAGFRILHLVNFLGFFSGGWTLSLYKPATRTLAWVTLILFLLRVLLHRSSIVPGIDLALIPLLVLWIGRHELVPGRSLPDWSYGFYLWGRPVQQTLIHFRSDLTTLQLTFLATLLTLPIAALSWHRIEAPLLKRTPSPKANLDVLAP